MAGPSGIATVHDREPSEANLCARYGSAATFPRLKRISVSEHIGLEGLPASFTSNAVYTFVESRQEREWNYKRVE